MDMRSNAYSWPQVLLRAWIMAWMLAVPLFHIHPEADHHHGESGHIHGGTVHTIFSPDLDGEFDSRQETATSHESQPAYHTAVAGHPAHDADYAELGFSFVNDSTDRAHPKPLATSALIVEPPALAALAARPLRFQNHTVALPLTILTRDIPARAPPASFI